PGFAVDSAHSLQVPHIAPDRCQFRMGVVILHQVDIDYPDPLLQQPAFQNTAEEPRATGNQGSFHHYQRIPPYPPSAKQGRFVLSSELAQPQPYIMKAHMHQRLTEPRIDLDPAETAEWLE